MPRTNSLSDSSGRSLTPDLEDEFAAATPSHPIHVETAPVPVLNGRPSADLGLHRVQTHRTQQSRRTVPKSSPWAHLTPKERFKAAVRRVMAMRRGTSFYGGARPVGAEPGIDPNNPSSDVHYGHIQEECTIEIVDFSAVRYNSRKMANAEFVDLMNNDETWDRQQWVKVRWINIGGLSWDVIKALAKRYTLHPLALEDVFHGHTRNRSKADYYTKHLFLRVLCHELVDDAQETQVFQEQPRSASPAPFETEDEKLPMDSDEKVDEKTLHSSYIKSRNSTLRRRPILPTTIADLDRSKNASGPGSRLGSLLKKEIQAQAAQEDRIAADTFLEKLKEGERVNVKVTPMFMFLFRDGTVISIHHNPDLEFFAPISARLSHRDTVLRKSVDASLLIHALLDITVDKALQVIDEYHKKINYFERKILLRTSMKIVRQLHILDGDLILHKRTLDPIKTMIYSLRRYDVDRVAALIDMSDPANKDVKPIGYMSHKAKIYLADVHDHMDYILTSLDMFSGIAENLVDYTFNVASYEMNETMRRLTLATIIFLPLTLLTGYFGMNFARMWSVQQNSDVLFWEIALPMMALVIVIFMRSDIQKMYFYISKRMVAHKIMKPAKERKL